MVQQDNVNTIIKKIVSRNTYEQGDIILSNKSSGHIIELYPYVNDEYDKTSNENDSVSLILGFYNGSEDVFNYELYCTLGELLASRVVGVSFQLELNKPIDKLHYFFGSYNASVEISVYLNLLVHRW